MTKKYFLLFMTMFALTLTNNAQTTIFDPDFSDGTYTGVAAVETDLVAHADWNAGHFGNSNTWVAFKTGAGQDVLRTGAFFTWMLANTPITAADGDVITVRTVVDYGFTGQSFGTEPDENMAFVGLLNQNNPQSGSEGNTPNRDGVMVVNKGSTNQIALTNNNGAGTPFDANSAILATESSHLYEVTIEYTIGSTAAASTKKARISSINGDNGASISSVSTGLSENVYNSLTGSGAYFFNWALRFGFGSSEISHLHMRRVEITKNSAVLSTNDFNNFDFSISPNPVSDVLTISSQENIKTVEIYNLLGKKVLTSNSTSIDVSSLSKSVYLLKLSSDKGVSTKKLIKN